MEGRLRPLTKLLLTVEEAGAAIGLHRSKMYKLMDSGEVESIKIGKSRRIPAEALAAYVAALRDEQAAPGQPA
jgi:excisionase family DNA binding protein